MLMETDPERQFLDITRYHIPILFNKFRSHRHQIYGGYTEINGFPSTRFNIGQFMSDNLKQKILKKHGGY